MEVTEMDLTDNLLITLCSSDIFRRIMTNQPVTLFDFNAATNYLVFSNIPFDISFDGATRKLSPAMQLTIHINPSRTEVLVVSLAPGSNAFSPSP